MIEKLTKAQEKMVLKYRKLYLEIGCNCDPADRKTAEKSITRMYEVIGKKKPVFVWFDSPSAVVLELQKNGIKNQIENSWWGSFEAYWISFYEFCSDVLKVKYNKDSHEKLKLWNSISKSCGWWFPYENICICC